MKIAIKNSKIELNEIITKSKIDLVSQNAERKKRIDYFIEIGLLKADEKNNYYIYNPYSDTTKYPNTEKALEFLIKIYDNHEINEENPFEDLDVLEENLKTFEDLKKRNIVPADIKNKHIGKFTYQEIKNIISQYTGQGEDSKVSLDAITKMGRNIKMEELPNIKPPFKVIKVNDVPTATKLAKGSNWCVQHENYAKSYLTNNPERGPLYFVYENDNQYALFSFGTPPSGELMIPNDTRITAMAMQRVKDHWSNLLSYLHAFNIHEYDADLSNFSKSLDDYLNSVDEIPNPITHKYADVLQYNDENLMNFITKRDLSFIKDQIDENLYSKLSKMDSKELNKKIIAMVKSEILKSIDELSTKIKIKVYPVVEKGIITFNLKYKDLFTYSNNGYDNNSVDALIKKGISDPAEIVRIRVKDKIDSVRKYVDKFSTVITYDTIDVLSK